MYMIYQIRHFELKKNPVFIIRFRLESFKRNRLPLLDIFIYRLLLLDISVYHRFKRVFFNAILRLGIYAINSTTKILS